MNRAWLRQRLPACCLLAALLSACADAGPSPGTSPAAATSTAPAMTPTAPAGAPRPAASSGPAQTATSGGPANPTGPRSGAAFQPGPCTFRAWIVVETACGTLTVPEDHGQPNGRQIKLAVAILTSSAAHPAPDPVLFLQGGPGLSVLTNHPEFYMPDFYPLLETRDVILLEQRGVGLSQPALDCPEEDQAAALEDQHGLRGGSDPGPYLRLAMACRARVIKAGANLASYTTAQGAADVEALRQALGYARWNLFGLSYGTRLALTVMRDFPAGVRSAILDSPLPPQASIARVPANVAAAFEQLFAACAADAACNRAYPSLKQVFYSTVDRLNKAPVQRAAGQGQTLTITGDWLMRTFFEALSFGSVLPSLPGAIYAARHDDFIAWMRYAASGGPTSTGLFYSVWCSEQILPPGLDTLTAADNAYPQQDHVFSPLQDWTICRQWGVPAAPAREQQAVRSAIPSLILSGRFDPRTPPSYAAETASTLQYSYLFTFANQGHAVSHAPCAMTLAATFVNNPAVAPVAACFAGQTAPTWDTGP